MKNAPQLLLLSVLSAHGAAVLAADNAPAPSRAAVDTSKWECKLCKFEDGLSGTLEAGAANVSDTSAKFGEYNGLHEEGTYAIVDGEVRYRGKDAGYTNITARNLGLDTRALDAEGGEQGKYKLLLNYRELPHFVSDSAQTPFIGAGGASLTRPAGFPQPTTSLMPLAGTLRTVDLETKRQELGVGASWTPTGAWAYSANFRHEVREGTKGTSGAFFLTAAQLVAPVEYVTDQLEVSASYAGNRWQAKFAYYGSSFRNGNASLTWQNPFTAPFPGADAGQLALPPDNQFHQISASLGYQLAERTRATADIALGRVLQNEAFLAPTLNAALVVPPLPQASLDGQVNTLNASLKINSAVSDRLRLNGVYSRNERDNRTAQATYAWVTTDAFLATPRTNLPYSFTQDKLALRADYKATPHVQASAGFDHDSRQRTFQEADVTRENTLSGKIIARATESVDLTFKLAHGERNNAGYQAVATLIPPENPLMRKFNMADRTRNTGEARADIAATESINIWLQVDASADDYDNSAIGLTSGSELNLSGDISMQLSEATGLHVFANRQEIKSKQAGSQTFSAADWRAENNDTITVIGIGAKHVVTKGKLDVGADYTVTRSKGAISIASGTTDPGFPDLSTSLDSLKLYANYRVRDDVTLRAGYWYERYDSEDWMLAGVTPGTIPNVLTFGLQPPTYRVHVISMSLRYKF